MTKKHFLENKGHAANMGIAKSGADEYILICISLSASSGLDLLRCGNICFFIFINSIVLSSGLRHYKMPRLQQYLIVGCNAMTNDHFQNIKNTFTENQKSVRQLMNFDRLLLDFCIMQVQELENRLKNNREIKLTFAQHLPTQTIEALQNIRSNDSMRPQYESIFNQCLVLSVSHFTSTIHSIFKEAINCACRSSASLLTASNEDIKITFDELKTHHFDLTESLGDLIVKKKDVSFQDMQSSQRAFKTFLDIDFTKDNHTNNIIVAQASRHAIVHVAGRADEKFMKQIRDAIPRDVKMDIKAEQVIQFKPDEIEKIQSSMTIYTDLLIQKIRTRISQDLS